MHESKRKCSECGKSIPRIRLSVLPGTKTCVRCSNVKTTTEDDVVIDSSDPDDMDRMVKTSNGEH